MCAKTYILQVLLRYVFIAEYTTVILGIEFGEILNEIFPSFDDRDMSEFESHGQLNGFFFRKHHVRIRALHVDKLKTVVDFVD